MLRRVPEPVVHRRAVTGFAPAARRSARIVTLVGLACIGLAACEAFAPQDGTIEVHVTGVPADPIATVTVFVEDPNPPHNRVSQTIGVAQQSVTFDGLGAGFDIYVGVTDTITHRCTVLDARLGTTSNALPHYGIVETSSNRVVTVAYWIRCRTGTIALTVAGLPPGDSVGMRFAAATDTIRLQNIRNGPRSVHVVPNPAFRIIPDSTLGSDGYLYRAAQQTLAVLSGQTATATVQYSASEEEQAYIQVTASGLPDDDGILLGTFLQRAGQPATRQHAVLSPGSSHRFTNVARGADYDVALHGLAAYRCFLREPDPDLVMAGDTARAVIRTSVSVISQHNSVFFNVRCRTGTADLVVSGLPAGDMAEVHIDAALEDTTVRSGNGTTRLHMLPRTWHITPLAVTGSDGRTYEAPAMQIMVESRAPSVTIAVPYARVTDPTAPGSIVGRVTAGGSGIAAATLTLTGPQAAMTTTAADGSYSFMNLPAGSYTVTVSGAPGVIFPATSQTATVIPDDEVTVDFTGILNTPPAVTITSPAPGSTWPPGATVTFSGSAQDAEDGVLTGASLVWTSTIDGPLGTGVSLARVLTAGAHTITLTATDAHGATAAASVAIVVSDPGTGSISGRVTGNGFGIGGATLTLTGPVQATATSDGSGNYTFPMLPAGTYTVSVSTELNVTFPANPQTVTLAAGQAITVNFAGTY
jgi:hypothetical protein